MESYEWSTIDGRFQAARNVWKLRAGGKEKEAAELTETLREATYIYQDPEYYVLLDKKNKQLLLLFGHVDNFEENGFCKFVRAHNDNIVCSVHTRCTWLPGMIVQQAEPIITAHKYERWNVFETDDGQLWFEQM